MVVTATEAPHHRQHDEAPDIDDPDFNHDLDINPYADPDRILQLDETGPTTNTIPHIRRAKENHAKHIHEPVKG